MKTMFYQTNTPMVMRGRTSFSEAIKIGFKKLFNVTDRARRSDYFWFCAPFFAFSILSLILSFIDDDYSPLFVLALLIQLIFTYGATRRRLNDIGDFKAIPFHMSLISILIIVFFLFLGISGHLGGNAFFVIILICCYFAFCISSVVTFVRILKDSEFGANDSGNATKYSFYFNDEAHDELTLEEMSTKLEIELKPIK